MHAFGPRSYYRPLYVLVLVYLLLSTLLRLGLWIVFGSSDVGAGWIPPILLVGLVNDVIQAAYLFIPLALYLWLMPARWMYSRPERLLFGFGAWLMLYGMLYLAACEFFFFEEFDARFNLVAVDYLIYPTEVLGNISDSYPVGEISAAFVATAFLMLFGLLPHMIRPDVHPRFRQRSAYLGVHALLVLLFIGFWRADSLSVFPNRVANELAANGPAKFFAAFRSNHLDYHAFYATGDSGAMLRIVAEDLARGGGTFTELGKGRLTRSFPARPEGFGKMNVVLLSEESFGAAFVGAYGDTRGLTPNFDALSREGMLFTRAYSTGTRTVRGLEAFSASFLPIPSESIVKRPKNEDIATWGKVMRGLGYETSFIYGGYGTFDNMNAFFRANGFSILDRTDMPPPRFANVWGICDEDLFSNAIGYFDRRAAEGRPFFSIVMSTSNHRPYTFPKGTPGIPERGGRSDGIKYADHALGQFFKAARSKPWFRNTLFIVAADHGARVYGSATIPLHSYEIPVLFYAPGRIASQRIDTRLSQIDIAPTVMGLLGLGYSAPFFGQDILHLPTDREHPLFMSHNHNIGMLRGDTLCVLGLQQEMHCERYERLPGAPSPETTRLTPMEDDRLMLEQAKAYYQTAYDLYQDRQYR